MYTMIRLTGINGDSIALPPHDHYRAGVTPNGNAFIADGEHLWEVKGSPADVADTIEYAVRETRYEQ